MKVRRNHLATLLGPVKGVASLFRPRVVKSKKKTYQRSKQKMLDKREAKE